MDDELRALHSAAHQAAVTFTREDRTALRVSGRAPSQMLSGLLSGAMPADLDDLSGGWRRGIAPCSAMLTPKGRMVSDMRVHRARSGPAGTLLLVLPVHGIDGASEHFRRYLPPRMAQVETWEPALACLSVTGPATAGLLSGAAGAVAGSALPVSPADLEEDEELVCDDGSESGLRIVRSGEFGADGCDVLGSVDAIARLSRRIVEDGAEVGSDGLRELLRIERGRPAFGTEMDEDTMPGEAGILERCVDTSKGCFTGQEVVVRIRDRGHVNRHLRGLVLAGPPDSVPATLYDVEGDKRVGDLRSAAHQPVVSATIGLGYVRRELTPPCTVRVGSPDGPLAQVRSLDRDGWRFEKGDASFYP